MKPDRTNPAVPMVGEKFGTLGVRQHEVEADPEGNVAPGKKGMSVSPSVETLPFAMVPSRYAAYVEGAAGDDAFRVWEMGEGPFRAGPVNEMLSLECTSATHGVICPRRSMPLQVFKESLAATQRHWKEVSP